MHVKYVNKQTKKCDKKLNGCVYSNKGFYIGEVKTGSDVISSSDAQHARMN